MTSKDSPTSSDSLYFHLSAQHRQRPTSAAHAQTPLTTARQNGTAEEQGERDADQNFVLAAAVGDIDTNRRSCAAPGRLQRLAQIMQAAIAIVDNEIEDEDEVLVSTAGNPATTHETSDRKEKRGDHKRHQPKS